MALTKCKECGNDVSTKAASCPTCGAAIKRKTGCLGCLGVVTLIFIVSSVVVSLLPDGSNTKRSKPQPVSSTTKSTDKGALPQSAQRRSTSREAVIPSDVSFSITSEDIQPGIKRSLEVRLNKKVSEQTLRTLALKLKSQDSRTYARTFIGYYLPGMEAGAGAWATTHFDPTLDVKILGLTAEEEAELAAQPEPANREVIGRWLDEMPLAGSRLTIFRERGRLFVEQTFKDGNSLKDEIVERKTPQGRRFDLIDASATGDYWIVGSDGALQTRDNDGLISTARRIK